jgi:hypothetical protein
MIARVGRLRMPDHRCKSPILTPGDHKGPPFHTQPPSPLRLMHTGRPSRSPGTIGAFDHDRLSFTSYSKGLSFSSTTCAGGIITKLSRKPAMPAITGAPAQKGTDQRMPLWKMAGPTI